MTQGGDESVSAAETFRNVELGLGERAVSAAGAAFISAIIVNPLDVAKTRLQAQAAGVPYHRICRMGSSNANTVLPQLRLPPSNHCSVSASDAASRAERGLYSGTLDVFYKVIREEGFTRLWRGTNASLALAVPTVGIYLPCYDILRNLLEDFTASNAPTLTPYTPLVAGTFGRSLACITCYPVELARTRMQAFKEAQQDVKLPGVWKTLVEAINPVRRSNNMRNLKNYRILWTGLGAQLARDVPFSAICWTILEPIRRDILSLLGDHVKAGGILGANFSAGFIAGVFAAGATCPLDVAKTRRQIETNPERALRMTTKQTLMEVWRDGGIKGLFTGVGPRIGRAGPSVAIVVSFYEVVKYVLHQPTRRRDSS